MTAVSQLHSEDGRQLLDTIDQLKLLPSISHEIALPQIVVVGQQSSGKSSVLKAISNINFPTNGGFCTQFATEIVCRRDATKATKAQIIPNGDVDDLYRARLEAFSRRWSQISPEQDVARIIESAKEVMGLDSHQRISKDKLRLEFCGPKQDHISLIDLPGLFEQELPGQRENDKRLVDEMVKEYISGSKTIVLAVVSGAYDVQVQRIFRMFEPHRDRTLGIITAPDLVEHGTARATTFAQLVANSSFKAGHGWHILRNLSHREEQDGKDRDEVEKDFFTNEAATANSVWATVPKTGLGIQDLKVRLATLLQGSIAEGLPQIQRQLRSALHHCADELKLLGNERTTTEQQRDYLAMKSELLRATTAKELIGGGGKQSLRSSIRNANTNFASTMVTFGAYWDFYNNVPPIRSSSSDPAVPQLMLEDIWIPRMVDKISNHRGRELDGLVESSWVGRMFLWQSRKWRAIAESHVDDVYAIVVQYFEEVIENVVGPEDAERFLVYAIQPELERRKTALRNKVEELLTPYTTEHIRTLNKGYHDRAGEVVPQRSESTNERTLIEATIYNYTLTMLAYYQLALSIFLDNIESLAVENVLLGGLEDLMTATKAHKMCEDDLALLASESQEVTDRRKNLTARMEDYEVGSRIITQYSIRSKRSLHSGRESKPIGQRVTPSKPVIASNIAPTSQAEEHVVTPLKSTPEELLSTQYLTPDNRALAQRGRRLSRTGSSRGSSAVSPVFSEDIDGRSSMGATPDVTPAKTKSARRTPSKSQLDGHCY